MPICKKCNNSFKNRALIDGKVRMLNHRKYCLICSPFGGGNRRNLEYTSKDSTCEECGRIYAYVRNSGHRLRYCNSCVANRQRFKRKQKCIDYLGGKCSRCGYNKCLAAMDFHHEKNKKFGISGNHTRSWEVVKKELDKCKLLCRNCHSELHYEESQKRKRRTREKT